jgi:hypothetical protein
MVRALWRRRCRARLGRCRVQHCASFLSAALHMHTKCHLESALSVARSVAMFRLAIPDRSLLQQDISRLLQGGEQQQEEAQASRTPTANRSVSVAKCLHIPWSHAYPGASTCHPLHSSALARGWRHLHLAFHHCVGERPSDSVWGV